MGYPVTVVKLIGKLSRYKSDDYKSEPPNKPCEVNGLKLPNTSVLFYEVITTKENSSALASCLA